MEYVGANDHTGAYAAVGVAAHHGPASAAPVYRERKGEKMNQRRKTVLRWFASLLAILCFAAGVSASTSNWMQREGTIGHALTLDDGA